MRKINNPVAYLVERELQALYLLAPIFFGTGVWVYFSLHDEPRFTYSLIAFILTGITLTLSLAFKKFRIFAIFTTFLVAGFFFAEVRAISVKSTIIEPDLGKIWVRAKIISIDLDENSAQLLLNDLDLWQPETGKFAHEKTPEKMRVTVRTDIDKDITPGDIVAFKAILSPPAENPAYPGGYDFNRIAYFRKIGAIGYAISPVEIYEKKKENWIDRLQDYYFKKANESISDPDLAGIVVSQITADRVVISDATYQSMRKAGLGHLIAISGMNMSVAMVWMFFLARSILAFFPRIALQYDTKKLSCIVAFTFGTLYLLITGMPVSAVRAFIMVLLFFAGILSDRPSISLHSVGFAALCILIITPENLVSPSFQLSFAAVIGLIGMYEIYENYIRRYFTFEPNFIMKMLLLLLGIMFTTICTSITTAPFGILHFGTFSNYGVIANMIGVPAASIIVLPFAFLALAAMPFGVAAPFLKVSAFGARIIRDFSFFVSNRPGSVSYFADIPPDFIIYIIAGFLILFIFRTWIRFLGLPLVFYGYFLILQPPEMPDLVINQSGSLIALRQENGSYKYLGAKRESFSLYQFNSKLGVQTPDYIIPSDECNRKRCAYKNVLIGSFFSHDDCDKYSYIINLGKFDLVCDKADVITKETLKKTGTSLFFLDKKRVITSDNGAKRLWNRD